jgi:threonine dehydratase
VEFKLEILQATGSFKLRGALNRILTLSPSERAREVVTASTGNHGAAVAHAAALVGTRARVFVPEDVAAPKLARMIASGAEIERVPGDPLNAELAARGHAEERGLAYVSPYNDRAVVAGQATVGLEIMRQRSSPPDAVLVPLGGGGLAAGVGTAIKSGWPGTQVLGCSPAASPAMIRSLQAGRVIDVPIGPTVSDGTAGGVEDGSITFELCREVVDEVVEVSEEEIEASLRDMIEHELLLVEGAAAVAVAGFRRLAEELRGPGGVVIVLSGANVSTTTLLKVLSSRPGSGDAGDSRRSMET